MMAKTMVDRLAYTLAEAAAKIVDELMAEAGVDTIA